MFACLLCAICANSVGLRSAARASSKHLMPCLAPFCVPAPRHAHLTTSALQRKMTSSNMFSQVGKGPTGVIKSVLDTARTDGGRRDEIFVDIVERISCTFNTSGYVQASQIDGAIQVGSLLNGLR